MIHLETNALRLPWKLNAEGMLLRFFIPFHIYVNQFQTRLPLYLFIGYILNINLLILFSINTKSQSQKSSDIA